MFMWFVSLLTPEYVLDTVSFMIQEAYDEEVYTESPMVKLAETTMGNNDMLVAPVSMSFQPSMVTSVPFL